MDKQEPQELNEEQNGRLELLNEALSAYEWLSKRKYLIKLGYKNYETMIELVFKVKNFVHAAGIDKLTDVRNKLASTSFDISSTALIYHSLMKGEEYKKNAVSSQYFTDIVDRLYSIVYLKENLEDVKNNRHVKFVKKDRHNYTVIGYNYLIVCQYENNNYHYFLRYSGNQDNKRECVLVSTFIENVKDYSRGQQQMTLLKKSIVELKSGAETVIYEIGN